MFSHSMINYFKCFLPFPDTDFWIPKLILMKPKTEFLLSALEFGVIFKKSLLNLTSQKCTPIFPSQSFKALVLTFISQSILS